MKRRLKMLASRAVPGWGPRLHGFRSRALYRAIPLLSGYSSQYGQDRFLDEEVFCRRTGGVFVDVGANDGVSFSNTYFLERERGWTGLCIEPHPRAYELLVANRHSACFNGCIGPASGSAQFLQLEGYCEMLSGLVDEYSDAHLARVDNDLALHGGTKTLVDIAVESFDELLKRYEVAAINFLKIDTEGSELSVLNEVFRTGVPVEVVSVENTYDSPAIFRFLRSQGFRLIARIGDDEIYRHRSSVESQAR